MNYLYSLVGTTTLSIAVVSCGQQRDTHHPPSSPSIGNDTLGAAGSSSVTSPTTGLGTLNVQAIGGASTGSNALQSGGSRGATQDSASPASDEGRTAGDAAMPPPPTIHDVLASICLGIERRADAKCSQQVAGLYRSSCAHYLQKSGPCDEPIRRLLECQLNAREETFCAHGADYNCAPFTRDLKICQRGSAPEEQTTTEDDRTLPSAWQPVEDAELGFTVMMPPGAALDPDAKRRTWKATDGSIAYYVAAIDAPAGKLNNQAFVRSVVAYVGSRCQLHLKLHGELEYKGTTVVQYHSACPDKTEWHGMLHFWNGKGVSTGYHAAPGDTGVREPFFYSFTVPK